MGTEDADFEREETYNIPKFQITDSNKKSDESSVMEVPEIPGITSEECTLLKS